MKRAALILVAVLLCLAPAAALAQMPPNALTLKAGAYFPQADDVDEFDTGFNMELSYTRYFHPNFALEFGVGYFNSEADGVDLTSYPFTLNLKGVYPFMGAELYALAGIGAYYVKVENGFDENDTVFGYQLGIGANFDIVPGIFVGAEGKYFWAKPDFGTIDTVVVGERKIDGILATINLGYRF